MTEPEPRTGGRFYRDPETGKLEPEKPPEPETDQAPAAEAAPARKGRK